MRRHLLTTATLTLLLTAVPASAALAGERAGDPVEEADDAPRRRTATRSGTATPPATRNPPATPTVRR